MNKLESLFNSINSGNKEAIHDFIVSSRQFVLNTTRCFVNNDNDAIDIAKKVYEKIIFNENKFDKNNISEYLYSLVKEEVKNNSNDNLQLVDLDSISNNISAIEVDDGKYSKYYNNPKVERVLYDTINGLPKEEKEIIVRHYFGQESVSDIAKNYDVSEDIINKYISNANNIIETTSKPLFAKYKIETADYSNVAIIYSTIKKCISIVNFDVVGIVADKVKDTIAKKDDEEEKDLKSFAKDILEDLVQDWFLERIKSVFGASTIGATSTFIANTTEEVTKNTFIKGTAKKAGVSLAKKVLIGAAVTGVAVTGGVVANNVIKAKNDSKIIETADTVINAEMSFSSIPVFVDFYSSDENDEVSVISAEFALDKKSINETELKAIEATALATGINIKHYESGDSFIINIIANKESLGSTFINLATSLNLFDEDELNELKNIMNYNINDLNDFLFEKGYIRLFVD